MLEETRLNRIKEDFQAVSRAFNGVNDPSRLVDPGQCIRQIQTFVKELDESVSLRLKDACLVIDNKILEGTVFQAERKEVSKVFVDVEKVRKLLGKKVSKVESSRTEIHLKYKPRF